MARRRVRVPRCRPQPLGRDPLTGRLLLGLGRCRRRRHRSRRHGLRRRGLGTHPSLGLRPRRAQAQPRPRLPGAAGTGVVRDGHLRGHHPRRRRRRPRPGRHPRQRRRRPVDAHRARAPLQRGRGRGPEGARGPRRSRCRTRRRAYGRARSTAADPARHQPGPGSVPRPGGRRRRRAVRRAPGGHGPRRPCRPGGVARPGTQPSSPSTPQACTRSPRRFSIPSG